MKTIYERFLKAEIYTASVGLAACTVVIFSAAVARSLDRPLNWSMDIALFLFAWSVFLGADAALRNDRLVNVDLLVRRLPAAWQRILGVALLGIILAFLLALLVYGLRLSWTTRRRAFQGIPGFSYTWVTLSIPVGAALQIATITGKLRARLRRPLGRGPRAAGPAEGRGEGIGPGEKTEI